MDRIGRLLDRPLAYNNIDGVGELGLGFMCLSYALLGWLQVHSAKDSFWNQMYTLFIYLGLMSLTIHYGSKAIKKRITYPRTGFVEYRKRDTVWRPMIIAGVVSMLTSVVVATGIRKHWDLTTPASLVVWAMALGSVVIAILPADMVGAVANHSWIARQFPARFYGAFWLSMTLYGTLTLISGGVSFWLYLRHTEAPAHESQ